MVTSFEIARKDIDLLDSLPWSCIFVDEVHRVKNVSSKLTLALHQFTSGRRFGLTGTMIQNSYQEMWTILDWTNPGQLGTSRQWYRLVVKPLTTGQSAAATEEERAKAQVCSFSAPVKPFLRVDFRWSLRSSRTNFSPNFSCAGEFFHQYHGSPIIFLSRIAGPKKSLEIRYVKLFRDVDCLLTVNITASQED